MTAFEEIKARAEVALSLLEEELEKGNMTLNTADEIATSLSNFNTEIKELDIDANSDNYVEWLELRCKVLDYLDDVIAYIEDILK